jgi:hypothetical protein
MVEQSPYSPVRIALWLTGMLTLSACTGSSCTSCLAPIPGGYPLSQRIEGAVQARINPSGLLFVQNNAASLVSCMMPGGLDFCLPQSQSNINVVGVGLGTAMICELSTGTRDANGACVPGGQCDVHLAITGLTLTPQAGADTLAVEVRLLVFDTAKNGKPASDLPVKVDLGLMGTSTCHISLDSERAGAPTIGFKLHAKLKPETAAGTGYTQVSFENIAIVDLDTEDIDITGDFLCDIVSWFKSYIIDQMRSSLTGTVQSMLAAQLCQKCTTVAECPAGVDRCEGGVCMFGNGTCLQVLGTEGRLDLGAQLATLAPGLEASIDVLARAGGTQWTNVATNASGLNLGLFGGARAPARDSCVPEKPAPVLPPVPPAPIFTGAAGPPIDAHVALGVHDSFLNAAAFGAWEAGALCLDVGTETSDLLNSGTFSILIRSLSDLTHGDNVPIRLSIRPQNPPVIELGQGTFNADGTIAEPLIKVALEDFAMELYVLIDERFVRVLVIHADVTLPLGLRLNDQHQLELVMGDVKSAFTNVRVTDSGMLADDPQDIANALPQVLGIAMPTLATAFQPIDVPGVPCQPPDTRALRLDIPTGGITGVEGSPPRFLGIFATLGLPAAPARFRATATAEVVAVDVPPTEAFALGRTFDPRRGPRALIRLGGFGLDGSPGNLEWTWRVDGGFWSPFVRTPEIRLEGGSLWLQGRHAVDVRARERDAPETTSAPVSVEVLVDSVAPRLALERDGAAVRFVAWDAVTPAPRLEYSFGPRGGDASPFGRTASAPWDPRGLEVRARDEAGNVTVATIGVHVAADGPPPAAAGCATGGRAGSAAAAVLLGAGLVALGRRRRRAGFLTALVALGLGLGPGCSCDGGAVGASQEDGGELADPIYTRGPTGRYSSLAADAEGQLYVSAYEEAYGDLLCGTIGPAPDFAITWEIVDGVPPDARVKGDERGWRYGLKDAGDNVGLYTSLAIAADGKPAIAYRESTPADRGQAARTALKYAARTSTTCARSFECWQSHLVDEQGNPGYYANLTYAPDGKPTIAYLAAQALDPATGTVSAEVRFAMAQSSAPAQAGDWTIVTVDRVPVSCAGACAGPQVCVKTTLLCATPDSAPCPTACSNTQACLAGACADVLAAPAVPDLPAGRGLFVVTVRDRTGRPVLVYYDRQNGDLWRAIGVGSPPATWELKALDTDGDVGRFPSAMIDAEDALHVAYAEAVHGRLLYLKTKLTADAVPQKEFVDDGNGYADGPHTVGWDAQLLVDVNGSLHVLYQDGRAVDLLHAVKTPGGVSWTVAAVRQDAKAGYGFFARFVRTPQGGLFYSNYRYDRRDAPVGEITKPEDAVRPLPQGPTSRGNTFGWLEVGQL